MPHLFLRLILLAVVIWPVSGAWAQVLFPQSSVQVVGDDGGSHTFTVELARSADQLEQGLMYRRQMAADAGMLFDFGASRPVAMWMKNTFIPLDMVFITAEGRISGIAERAVPHSLATISSPGPVKAVLELNSGTASRLKLKVGDRVVHPIFAGP